MQSNTSINEKQYKEVMVCLSELTIKLGLNTVLLINSAGRILAEKTKHDQTAETTVLATLASGSYAAAAEIARQLGESDNFQMMLYEGQNQNIFISSISNDLFLVIIFEKDAALGIVRLLAKRTITQLQPIFSEKSKDQFANLFDEHFQGLLNEKLDQSFFDE